MQIREPTRFEKRACGSQQNVCETLRFAGLSTYHEQVRPPIEFSQYPLDPNCQPIVCLAIRLASEHHYEAVDSTGDAAVRRCAELERLEHVPEPPARCLQVESDQLEDLLLHLSPMDPDAPAGHLLAVAHQVVLLTVG